MRRTRSIYSRPILRSQMQAAVELSLQCAEGAVSEIAFVTDPAGFGIPDYRYSATRFHDGGRVPLPHGGSFVVADGDGRYEEVFLQPADFPDPDHARIQDVLRIVSLRSSLVEAGMQNGFAVFRGRRGGASAHLAMWDGHGTPLAKLGVPEGEGAGSGELTLRLVVPEERFHVPDRPYLLMASGQTGRINFRDRFVPIGMDDLFLSCLRATSAGDLPDFIGRLGPDQTADVTIPHDLLAQTHFKGQVHLACAVLADELDTIEFVSNRVTVAFE